MIDINVHQSTLLTWTRKVTSFYSHVAVGGSPEYHEITETSIGYRYVGYYIDWLALFIHSELVNDTEKVICLEILWLQY